MKFVNLSKELPTKNGRGHEIPTQTLKSAEKKLSERELQSLDAMDENGISDAMDLTHRTKP